MAEKHVERCASCNITRTSDTRPAYWRKGMCPKCYQKHLRDCGRLGARGGKRKSPGSGGSDLLDDQYTDSNDRVSRRGPARDDRLKEAFQLTLDVLGHLDGRLAAIEEAIHRLDRRAAVLEGHPEQAERGKPLGLRQRFLEGRGGDTGRKGGAEAPAPFAAGVAQLREKLKTIYSDLNLG